MTPPESTPQLALPPETLEGWYALHQVFAFDTGSGTFPRWRESGAPSAVRAAFEDLAADQGWTIAVELTGSSADLMLVHLRPTLEALRAAQDCAAQLEPLEPFRSRYSLLSVTEAGLYHLTAKLAREAAERGGAVNDDTYRAELAKRVQAERSTPHVQQRLFPRVPEGMPYVCFYPMSKRRNADQNWYSLTLDERSRLMQSHGTTGRRYAGRVLQIITGSIGLDAWEWGVTLFAKDPLDFKKLVTDMRFDRSEERR